MVIFAFAMMIKYVFTPSDSNKGAFFSLPLQGVRESRLTGPYKLEETTQKLRWELSGSNTDFRFVEVCYQDLVRAVITVRSYTMSFLDRLMIPTISKALIRPSVLNGYTRLEWKCVSGPLPRNRFLDY